MLLSYGYDIEWIFSKPQYLGQGETINSLACVKRCDGGQDFIICYRKKGYYWTRVLIINSDNTLDKQDSVKLDDFPKPLTMAVARNSSNEIVSCYHSPGDRLYSILSKWAYDAIFSNLSKWYDDDPVIYPYVYGKDRFAKHGRWPSLIALNDNFFCVVYYLYNEFNDPYLYSLIGSLISEPLETCNQFLPQVVAFTKMKWKKNREKLSPGIGKQPCISAVPGSNHVIAVSVRGQGNSSLRYTRGKLDSENNSKNLDKMSMNWETAYQMKKIGYYPTATTLNITRLIKVLYL